MAAVVALVLVGLFALLVFYFFLVLQVSILWTGYGIACGLAVGLLLVAARAALLLGGHVPSPVLEPADGYLNRDPARPRRDRHDFAWQQYFVYQVRLDLRAIVRRWYLDTVWLWRAAWRLVPRLRFPYWVNYQHEEGDWYPVGRPMVVVLGLPLAVVPGGFLVGVTAGGMAAVVLLVTGSALVTALAWSAGGLAVAAQRGWERWWRWAMRTTACCTACYFHTELPVYLCPADHGRGLPADSNQHRHLRPGRRGVLFRRCGCGERLPASRLRAGRVLEARCPKCDMPLPDGAGWVTELRIGVFGAAEAGKTRLVDAAVRRLTRPSDGGPSIRLDQPSAPDNGVARAITLRVTHRHRPTVVHIFDAPGARLVDPARNREHLYFDAAAGLLFVLDPCSIAEVRAELATPSPHLADADAVATHDPEDSYQALVTALRRRGVNTGRQHLAFVLTKADVVGVLPTGEELSPTSRSVRGWLQERGLDNVVLAAERDFRAVRYFLTAAGVGEERDVTAPLRWLLRQEGLALPAGEAG